MREFDLPDGYTVGNIDGHTVIYAPMERWLAGKILFWL